MDQFSFNISNDDEKKTFARPSSFYKKSLMLNNNISDIFLTNTNIEQPSHHPLKIKADHKNPLNHLVTFEANASKSYLIVDKDNIFSDEYKFKPRSLNNDYLSNPQKKSFSRKKYEKLRKNLSFLKQDENDQKYNYGYFGIMPLLFFFKYLASTKILKETQDCLKLNLPDTIIINEEDFSPIWLYTSQTGFVHKTENFLMKDIFERLGLVENADELVAVLKRPHFENQLLMGNDSKLFSTKDLNEWCNESLLGRRGEMNVIQRYIKPKGPRAFVNRSIWRKNGKNQAWMITNKINFNAIDEKCLEYNKYCTNLYGPNECSIIPIKKGKTMEDTIQYLENIVKYFLEHKRLKFDELVGDFIKDENDVWWLINVKGFIINDPNYMNSERNINFLQDYKTTQKLPPKKEKYCKLKKCKYCEIPFDINELKHKLTRRMLIQIDLHLINRGKDFEWLERSIKLTNLNSETLCKEHFVCISCYTLHTNLEVLMRYELEFANLCGIPTSTEKTFCKKNISLATFANKNRHRSKSWSLFINNKFENNLENFIMPENWECNIKPLTEIMVLNNQPRIFFNNNPDGIVQDYLYRYRFIIFLSSISEIPLEYQIYNNYFLKFTFLDQTIQYKLNFENGEETTKGFSLFVNKLKTFYFYTSGKEQIKSFLKKKEFLTINLWQNDKTIGTVRFELNTFLNDLVVKREYYKFVESKYKEIQTMEILNCGFDLAIGLYQGDFVNVNHIILKEYDGLYIPNQDYYTCDPFPDEWFNMIQQKKENYRRTFILK